MLDRHTDSNYKRRQQGNYYTPSYSSIATFSFPDGPTVFSSRRNIEKHTQMHGTSSISDNSQSSRDNQRPHEEIHGVFEGIKGAITNTSKFLFNWMRAQPVHDKQEDDDAADLVRNPPATKRLVSGSLLAPNKRKHSTLHDEEPFFHSTPQRLADKSKTQKLDEKLNNSITPSKKGNIIFCSSKDPFKWDKTKDEQDRPKNHVEYGSTFFRRRGLERQKANNVNHLTNLEPPEEISYLRMVFNGEYRAPNIIEEQKDEQHRILEQDRIRSSSTNNPIVNLTERIKAALAEKKSASKDDDLIIINERKVETPKFTNSRFYNQRLKFDTSLLTFEEEFKSYKTLLEERKKLQAAVREKKQKKKLLPDLSQQDIENFQNTLTRTGNDVLLNKNNIELKVHDFKTLAPKRWLNDTIIEFFMKFIETHTPNTVAFNSYFYTTLSQRGYQGVRRWMKRKKTQIEDLDLMFVPINLNQSHWALGVIDFVGQKILYIDSLSSGPNSMSFAILKDLQNYLLEESKGTLGEDYELCHLDCPQQPNGFDCGIYVCMNALYLSRKAPLDFDYSSVKKMRTFIGHLILSDK